MRRRRDGGRLMAVPGESRLGCKMVLQRRQLRMRLMVPLRKQLLGVVMRHERLMQRLATMLDNKEIPAPGRQTGGDLQVKSQELVPASQALVLRTPYARKKGRENQKSQSATPREFVRVGQTTQAIARAKNQWELCLPLGQQGWWIRLEFRTA